MGAPLHNHPRRILVGLGSDIREGLFAACGTDSSKIRLKRARLVTRHTFGSRVGYTLSIDSANEVLHQPRPFLWFAPALN